MFLSLKKVFFVFVCFLSLSACEMSSSHIGVIDVNSILSTGVHADKAMQEINKAQEIYQYNLNVIEKKLSAYENKEQANEYLTQAINQLQTQMNNSRAAVMQSLTTAFHSVIEDEKKAYDILLFKNNIIHTKDIFDITSKVQEKFNAVVVTYPPLPNRIDEPNLPADKGITKEVEKKSESKQKDKK